MTLRRQPSAVCAREREERCAERFFVERAAGAAETERRRVEADFLLAVVPFADGVEDVLRLEAVFLEAALRVVEALRFGAAFLFGAALRVVEAFLAAAFLFGAALRVVEAFLAAAFLFGALLRVVEAFLAVAFLFGALLRVEEALRLGAAFLAAVDLRAVVFLAVVRLAGLFFVEARFFVRRLLVDEDARLRWSLNMALPPIVYFQQLPKR